MKNSSFHNTASALCYIILIGIILSSSPALANKTLRPELSERQQNQISGIITDGRTPLPGVTISIKNRVNYAVLSDFDGKYSLLAKANDTLVVSYIGYKTAIIPINYRKNIHIQLQEDITSLQEVRINAGYYSVKEKERTGSIARITAKDIETQPVTNVLAAMQGRMAGVNITQTTGVPGGGFDIQIRGHNSLRADGNRPLYIINGVPYASDPIGFSATASIMPTLTSPLNNLNPGDIESIEVLKDADATAIYGSRGANGVVLITTKKGKAGKTTYAANYSYGFGKVTRFMDLMNTEQYLEMRKEAYANDGYTKYPASAYEINGTWDQTRNTNWQKVLTGGTSTITNLQSSVMGGNEYTQFIINGNYGKETTVFPGDFGYKKGNVRINLNHASENKKFGITFSAGYTVQDNNQPSTDLTTISRKLAPNAPTLYDAAGELNWENSTWENPLSNLNGKSLSKTYDFVANTILSYQLPYHFELKSSFGFTELKHTESSTFPSTIYNPAYGLSSEFSSLFTNSTSRQSWIIEPQINWHTTIGQAKITMLLGSTFNQLNGEQLVLGAEGFTSNSLIYDLASASNVNIMSSDDTEYKYQAFFCRANLSWQDRYFVNVTARKDGSSRFGPGNKFANFGAIGAAWLFTKDSYTTDGNTSLLSFGKLRASYGITGNDQIGDYQYLDSYSSSGNPYQGIVGLEPTRLFNSNFGWENNKKLEIATELGFFKDRVFLTAGWFRNTSSSQLVGIPLPGTTGFNSIQANLDASVQNDGIELTLRTAIIQRKDFGWSSNYNISISKNKLLRFPDLESSTYANKYVIGAPLNIVKVYNFTGLDPATGLYQFEDFNGDGVLSAKDDKKYLSDLNPAFYGALQNQLHYKGLQLDFLFQFVKQLNYNSVSTLGLPGSRNNQTTDVLAHWQNPSDVGPFQQYSTGAKAAVANAFTKYRESDASITDASYIRLKNISLSYELPSSWIKGVVCKFNIQAQNLVTFTSYRGADPEFKTRGGLPPLKIVTTGFQFSF
ncbi:SusC/RagA family TonB-linked outer membrane protein [Flavobacterium acetivorans]|uniref:SusC/RagA family TonB-linked outer membrane protein n=1 Tax=Flavobacterium acetivorans TaxID=2893883 RepID=UPI001E427343|nr:SusC/RagA family TonB-linked outer membrane protein [Flavobacterium sp. F-29]UFH36534.1 SusC/RagA family TonB-linked outer membrane protein [Flavobacterium sp. F-29]